jgi:hypothetical protein
LLNSNYQFLVQKASIASYPEIKAIFIQILTISLLPPGREKIGKNNTLQSQFYTLPKLHASDILLNGQGIVKIRNPVTFALTRFCEPNRIAAVSLVLDLA